MTARSNKLGALIPHSFHKAAEKPPLQFVEKSMMLLTLLEKFQKKYMVDGELIAQQTLGEISNQNHLLKKVLVINEQKDSPTHSAENKAMTSSQVFAELDITHQHIKQTLEKENSKLNHKIKETESFLHQLVITDRMPVIPNVKYLNKIQLRLEKRQTFLN